jgi:hypothetical protein
LRESFDEKGGSKGLSENQSEEQRSRGAEERRSGGAEERRSEVATL